MNVKGVTTNKPDPGTPEAIRLGCLCPPTPRQPAKLARYAVVRERLGDWMCVSPTCPVHGWKDAIRPAEAAA